MGTDAERSSGVRFITRAAALLRLLGRDTGGLSVGPEFHSLAQPTSPGMAERLRTASSVDERAFP